MNEVVLSSVDKEQELTGSLALRVLPLPTATVPATKRLPSHSVQATLRERPECLTITGDGDGRATPPEYW